MFYEEQLGTIGAVYFGRTLEMLQISCLASLSVSFSEETDVISEHVR